MNFNARPSTLLRTAGVLFLCCWQQVAGQDSTEELIFPIVASGFSDGGRPLDYFETSLLFFNSSPQELTGMLEVFTNTGEPLQPVSFSVGERTFPPNSLDAYQLFHSFTVPPITPPDVNGWARLMAPPGLSAQAEVVFFKEPFSPASAAHLPAVTPGREFSVLLVDRPFGRRLGLAVVNPSPDATAQVTIELSATRFRDFPACPRTLTLAPLHRINQFMDELCGPQDTTRASFPPPLAILRIRSDSPVAVSAVDVFPDGSFSALLTTRVQ